MEEAFNDTLTNELNLRHNAKIVVIGVGGGGSNAVNHMVEQENENIEYWVFNTDAQALQASSCEHKFILGYENEIQNERGLGAGGSPEAGRKAAELSAERIRRVVEGANMVFIAAGEGGGTGTGASPVVARIAKEAGALVLAIVTRPFSMEGSARIKIATQGIKDLTRAVDSIIIVSNDKLINKQSGLTLTDGFKICDNVLSEAVTTLTDIILKSGRINLDFADVKATMANRGLALISIGKGSGANKAYLAAQSAVNSPFLETSIIGARTLIIAVTSGKHVLMEDTENVINYIKQAAKIDENENDVNIKWGLYEDPSFQDDEMKVAIIATDFDKSLLVNTEDGESDVIELIKKDPKKEIVVPDYYQEILNDLNNDLTEESNEVSQVETYTNYDTSDDDALIIERKQ